MSDKIIPQRLYINTFTMASEQSVDYDWEIDLGVDVKVTNSLRLDSAVIENKLSPFYQSINYDYRDLDFEFTYKLTP